VRAIAAALVAFVVAAPAAAAAVPEVHATLDRRSAGLGDPIRYTVEARARTSGTLRVIADTGPFAVVSAPKTTRSRSGGVAVVRIEQTMICVDRGCAPGAKPRTVSLPPARASSDGASAVARAPAITIAPRVPASVVAASRAAYRGQTGVLPATTSVPPAALAAVLAAAAVALVAFALLLVARELRRRQVHGVDGPSVGRLELALRLLRESAGRPAPDRRRAADFAGRAAALPEVAEDATYVAWAPPDPEPADVGALAERIETAVGSKQ
jgi:hypothetical protein